MIETQRKQNFGRDGEPDGTYLEFVNEYGRIIKVAVLRSGLGNFGLIVEGPDTKSENWITPVEAAVLSNELATALASSDAALPSVESDVDRRIAANRPLTEGEDPFPSNSDKSAPSVEGMREALEKIARQKLGLEMYYHEKDAADYEHGYEEIVKIARRALVKEVGGRG